MVLNNFFVLLRPIRLSINLNLNVMKTTAIIVVNPVNGSGLFQYLEAFYENGIAFKTFAAFVLVVFDT